MCDVCCPAQHSVWCVQIYNLGNTNPHTVSELVELLEKCLDRKAKRFYRPVPPTGDVLSTYADVTAAKQANPFSPHCF